MNCLLFRKRSPIACLKRNGGIGGHCFNIDISNGDLKDHHSDKSVVEAADSEVLASTSSDLSWATEMIRSDCFS